LLPTANAAIIATGGGGDYPPTASQIASSRSFPRTRFSRNFPANNSSVPTDIEFRRAFSEIYSKIFPNNVIATPPPSRLHPTVFLGTVSVVDWSGEVGVFGKEAPVHHCSEVRCVDKSSVSFPSFIICIFESYPIIAV
jgi:hypothetical protein